jgi:hypothetical protein
MNISLNRGSIVLISPTITLRIEGFKICVAGYDNLVQLSVSQLCKVFESTIPVHQSRLVGCMNLGFS